MFGLVFAQAVPFHLHGLLHNSLLAVCNSTLGNGRQIRAVSVEANLNPIENCIHNGGVWSIKRGLRVIMNGNYQVIKVRYLQ